MFYLYAPYIYQLCCIIGYRVNISFCFLTVSQSWHHLLIRYFDKIKCYSDRPYLDFFSLTPETHIYIFLALSRNHRHCKQLKIKTNSCWPFLSNAHTKYVIDVLRPYTKHLTSYLRDSTDLLKTYPILQTFLTTSLITIYMHICIFYCYPVTPVIFRCTSFNLQVTVSPTTTRPQW